MNERSIFLEALDLGDPVQRADYLADACGDDGLLRERVEQLLQAHADAGAFLEQLPVELDETLEVVRDTGLVDAERDRDDLAFLEPCDTPGRIGRLGTYEIVEVLGRGGMGLVLRAVDVKLNRVVAIKVMAPELAANAMARQRFLREAQAAAAIAHPHVVTIHAVDEQSRLPFLVMECVEGLTLQEKIDARGALELKELLRIAAQTAAGLSAAHRQGIVHRDIKPGNVLLENGVERVKLTDFGLARAVDDVNITQTGQIAGTPQYMSPEQAEGKPIDYRSDLFSLGSVMYTMATGRPAFRANSALAVLRRVCDDTPRPIREINPEAPAWLAEIIDRLMAKNPDARIQTAEEVADLLNQHLAHLQQPSLVPQPASLPPVRLPVQRPESKPAPQPERMIAEPQRRAQTWAVVSIFLLAVVMLAAVGVVLSVARLPAPSANPPRAVFILGLQDPELRLDIWRDGSLVSGDLGGGQLELEPGDYELHVKNVSSSQIVHRETVSLEAGEEFRYRRSFALPKVTGQAGAAQPVSARLPEGRRFDGWGSALSPDGSRIVFQRSDKIAPRPTGDLVVLDMASGEQTVLIPGGKDPAWSPRPGGPIAFVLNPSEGVEEIWLVEPDGSDARKLVEGGFPSWSADGSTLYHYHHASTALRAVEIDEPAAEPRVLLQRPGCWYPAVSPDGSKVVLHRGNRLVVIELDTQREIAAVSLPTGWDGLLSSWSPDSRYVGYGSYAMRDDGLWILDLRTKQARQVLQGGLTLPRWSGDGKHLTFDDRRKKNVWVVDAESVGLELPASETAEAATNVE